MKTKKDPRHQARRNAVQTIFEWTFHPNSTVRELVSKHKESIDYITEYLKSGKSYDEVLFNDIIDGVPTNQAQIDSIIVECAPEWPLDQISKVDLAILRISIYELLHREETPTKVAIDEAVELAKEFGGGNSSKFVNGVLGTVVKRYVKEAPNDE